MKINKFNATLISLVLALFLMAGNVQAQKKFVNKALSWAEKGEDLDTALVLLNKALEDDKTKDWAKTYYARGVLFKAISTTENKSFKKLSEYPLVDASINFEKALISNGVATIKTLLDLAMLNLPNDIINAAITYYNEENFAAAFLYFERTFELKQQALYGEEIDTAIIFNTALMAQRAENYDAAIKYYSMAVEYNYGDGDTYSLLADSYKANNDTENYLNTLKVGFKKYPDNQSLFGNLINYFLTDSDDPKEAIEYLDYAIAVKPNNATLYSGKAIFFDKIGEKESSIENYEKAIELDGEFFEAYYNLGVLYFNDAIALTEIANEIKDNKKYEEAKEVADNKFKESLPYLEKAYELNTEDVALANTLRNLYYRLQMSDKYEALNKIIEE